MEWRISFICLSFFISGSNLCRKSVQQSLPVQDGPLRGMYLEGIIKRDGKDIFVQRYSDEAKQSKILHFSEGDEIEYTCYHNYSSSLRIQWTQIKAGQYLFYGQQTTGFREIKMNLFKFDDNAIISCVVYDVYGNPSIVTNKFDIYLRLTNPAPTSKKIGMTAEVDVGETFEMTCDDNDGRLYVEASNKSSFFNNPIKFNITEAHNGMMLFCLSLTETVYTQRIVRKIVTLYIKNEAATDALNADGAPFRLIIIMTTGIIVVLIISIIMCVMCKRRKWRQDIRNTDAGTQGNSSLQPICVSPQVIYAEMAHNTSSNQKKPREEVLYAEIIGVMAPSTPSHRS